MNHTRLLTHTLTLPLFFYSVSLQAMLHSTITPKERILQEMHKEVLTAEQQILKKTIENYRETPFRLSQERIKKLSLSVRSLFYSHPHHYHYLQHNLFFTQIDKHIIALEETYPQPRECVQALSFLAKICDRVTNNESNSVLDYGIDKIKQMKATFTCALPHDEAFEKRIYADQFAISIYNKAFTPRLYSEGEMLIKLIEYHAQQTLYVSPQKSNQWTIDIITYFSLEPHQKDAEKYEILNKLENIKSHSLLILKQKLDTALDIVLDGKINKNYMDALNILFNAQIEGSLSLFKNFESEFLTWKQTHFYICD